ncbi:MAG: zinc ribbon domain-containing protein [Chloroflexota bacterium]
MVLAFGLVLTVAVVVYVGYPLFSRQPVVAEAALEAAIAQRRRGRATATGVPARGPVCTRCHAANEPGDLFCARCGEALSTRACAACGAAYDEGDVFCAHCGASLAGRAR